jgi:hypothetical protein
LSCLHRNVQALQKHCVLHTREHLSSAGSKKNSRPCSLSVLGTILRILRFYESVFDLCNHPSTGPHLNLKWLHRVTYSFLLLLTPRTFSMCFT